MTSFGNIVPLSRRRSPAIWAGVVVFLIGLVLSAPVLASTDEPAPEKPVVAHSDWGGITFEVLVAVDRANLIVAGPEDYWAEQAYGPDEDPWIDAVSLYDGHYRYELRLLRALSDEEQEALAAAEEAGEDETMELLEQQLAPLVLRLSGDFTIEGGTLIAPEDERALK